MLAALLFAAAAGHPNSVSRTHIEVEGARARVEVAAQALTLIEELGGDADGDLLLDEGELAAQRPALEAYLREHLLFFAGAQLNELQDGQLYLVLQETVHGDLDGDGDVLDSVLHVVLPP